MKTRTATKSRKKSAELFSNRVRFNWGFHDAVQTVREHWNTTERNFGFGRGTLDIRTPTDVLDQHHDKSYAEGWYYGYYEALGGISTCKSSSHAWETALGLGRVQE
jgi:hypothetical protein